jgi:hypothetical protein
VLVATLRAAGAALGRLAAVGASGSRFNRMSARLVMALRSLSVRGARVDPGDGASARARCRRLSGQMNLHVDCWQRGESARCLVNPIVIS